MKTERLNIRISGSEKEALSTLAGDRDVPIAQIAREAIREKIIRIKSEHPAFADSEERRALDVIKRELAEFRQNDAALAE